MNAVPEIAMRSRLASALLLIGFALGADQVFAQTDVSDRLIDFGTPRTGEWFVVNDGVMGGVSRSTIRVGEEPGTAVFEGRLSLENNGGFASVRTPIPIGSLARARSIRMRVRGDGQRYQLRLRRGRAWDGVSFTSAFEPLAGEWEEIELPLDTFTPTFRGYRPRVAPLDPAEVGQLGIMLTDKQVGEFALEIAWIEVVG